MYNRIKNKLIEVQDKFEQLGLPKFPIDFSIKKLEKGVAGLAYNGYFLISEDYLRAHPTTVLSRTVPHEISHCYIYKYYPKVKNHHGREWKRLMEALGCDQSTYHKMKLSKPEEPKKNVDEKSKIDKIAGIFDVIWNPTISKYEGFYENKVVAISKSYREVKKIMESEYGCNMFNVVTPN